MTPPPPAALNLLVVEDNGDLREAIVDALARHGHRVHAVDCAEAVPELPGRAEIDIMVIDLNLPGEDGLSLARRLRQVQPHLGIIMLTARHLTEDKSAGYDHGADIYITKPASPAELHAAIQALARRMRAASARAAGGLELDMRRLVLHGAPGQVTLTPNEVQFLAALVRAPGQRLERWQLQQCLDAHSNPALEMLIARLRKKLQPLCGQERNPIQPLRGVGYQLCIDITLR